MQTTVTATVNGVEYEVSRPLNEWDMNYHFRPAKGEYKDYLVDLMDVLEWAEKDSATVDDAIAYAQDMVLNNIKFYWRVV